MKNSDPVCIRFSFYLGLFIMTLREEVPSSDLRLSTKKNGLRYFQRLPLFTIGKPCTDGGIVTFKLISSI